MLREIPETRQIRGEPHRRWFTSDAMDLYVWYDDARMPIGFQLCYGKDHAEKALTWLGPESFSHMAVDSRGKGMYAATPILVLDGHFDPATVLTAFSKEGDALPAELVDMVVERLKEYPRAGP